MISDFESEEEDNSIMDISQNEMLEINEEILNIQQRELEDKRRNNNYDQCCLRDVGHPWYSKLSSITTKFRQSIGLKERPRVLLPIVEAEPHHFYSEKIKIYANKTLREALMMVFEGYVYLVHIDEKTGDLAAAAAMQPFHLVQDLSKIIHSEKHEQYLALKIRDMRIFSNTRDHLMIEVHNRELFVDFVMEYAEFDEDEVAFEQNEEFSIFINSSPQWFSFDDIERSKLQQTLRQTQAKEMTGFLEIKQSKSIRYLKAIFGRKASWETRYFTLRGTRLYVYKGQKYNKPLMVVELGEELAIKEMRKADVDGKQFVMQLLPNKDAQPLHLAASSDKSLSSWLKAFKNIKALFALEKQRKSLVSTAPTAPEENEKQGPGSAELEFSPSKRLGPDSPSVPHFDSSPEVDLSTLLQIEVQAHAAADQRQKDQQKLEQLLQQARVSVIVEQEEHSSVRSSAFQSRLGLVEESKTPEANSEYSYGGRK